ncbi:hypothetical protein BS78_07G135200 [Paspalum vaginatum]|nr:hypothetical protein BS78_07G135200 [Paspalum vaginatum]
MSSRRVPISPTDGLLAVLKEPASAYLRVVEPVRTCSARRITLTLMAVTTDQHYCDDDSNSPLSSCKLCRRRMDGLVIYMYMGMGFCTEECRIDYFLDEEHEYMNRKYATELAAAERRTASISEEATAGEGGASTSHKRIFFFL